MNDKDTHTGVTDADIRGITVHKTGSQGVSSVPPADLLDEEVHRFNGAKRRTVVITGGTDNGALIAALQREIAGGVAFICHEDPPGQETVGGNDISVTGHVSEEINAPALQRRVLTGGGRLGTAQRAMLIASMQSIALSSVGEVQSLNTGRAISRRNSQRMEEELLRLREQRERHVGMHPAPAAPYGKVHLDPTSPESLARIAAAEAKRARKAAKKGSKP